MGSVLLGIVARRRSEKGLVDLDEYKGKELHLLETPPLAIRKNKVNFKNETRPAKIGKIARLGEKKVRDQQVENGKVSLLVEYLSLFVELRKRETFNKATQ